MPFSLKYAATTFQGLINIELSGLNGNEMFVYLDNVVLHAKTLNEHTQKYYKLTKRLRQANLRSQLSNCLFLRNEF